MTDDLGRGTWRERLHAWWQVLGLAFRASPGRSVLAVVAGASSMLWTPLLAIVVATFTDGVVTGDLGRGRVSVWLLLGMCVVQAAIGGLGFPLRMHVRELTGQRLDQELMELATGIDGVAHFEQGRYADRLATLRENRGMLAGAFDAATMNLLTLATIAFSVGYLTRIDRVLLLLPVFGIPAVLLSSRTSRRFERTQDELAPEMRLFRRLFDIGVSPVAGRELRVFGSAAALRDRHLEASRTFERTWLRTSLRNLVDGLLGRLAFSLAFVVALALLLRAAARGDASAGEVAGGVLMAGTVQGQVLQVVQMAAWGRRTAESARRFAWLRGHARAEAREVAARPTAPVPERLVDGIRMERVRFAYPDTDVDVLGGVDLHLPAGAIVAVVGDNGAGKSTLVKLLTRMYLPTDGRILVDGTDLAHVPAAAWRERLSAGFQDHARFELVARTSVGLGRTADVDDDARVRDALERAASADVLEALPESLDTVLGRGFADGHEPSGGQWQKLALGRAMMRPDPLLLVLDEPTAALDAEVEHALFERWSTAARDLGRRTGAITVLVSHRFSTVRAADLIVVVAADGIAEVGTHDELLAAGGTYAELFELQASSYR